jgi:hypothetical protein
MKAIIEFNLDDDSDKYQFKLCNKASDMSSVIFEFKYKVRQIIEDRLNLIKDKEELLDNVFNYFDDLLIENNVSIDDLLD